MAIARSGSSWAWARAWGRTTMPPAVAALVPSLLGLMLLGAVLFGGTGIDPGALVQAARGDLRALAGLTLGWLLLVGPAVLTMRRAPGLPLLKSLPRGRGVDGACTMGGLVVLHLPWMALWWHGAGPGVAGLALAAIAALSLAIAALPERRLPRGTPGWRGPLRALVGTSLRGLTRHGVGALARALALALAGGLLIGAMWRHAVDEDAVRGALAVAALTVGLTLAGPSGVVAQAAQRAPWLPASLGLTPGQQIGAAAIVLGGLGAALGAIAASLAWLVAPPPDVLAAIAVPVLGAALGIAAAAALLVDGAQRTVTLALAIIGAILLALALGPIALLLVPTAAAAHAAAAATRATRRLGAASR